MWAGLSNICAIGELPLCDSHLLQEFVSVPEEGKSYMTLGPHFYWIKDVMFMQEVNLQSL